MNYLTKFFDGSNEVINNLQAGQSLVEQDKDDLCALIDWLDTMLYVLDWADGGTDARGVLESAAYAFVEIHHDSLICDMRTLLYDILRVFENEGPIIEKRIAQIQRDDVVLQYLYLQGLPGFIGLGTESYELFGDRYPN